MTEVWCYFFKSSRTISTFNFSITTTQNLRLFVLSHQNIFPFHLFISYAFLFTPFPLSERPKEDNNGFTPIFLALILGLRHVFLPHEWRKELVTKSYEIDCDANPIFCSNRVFSLAGIVMLICIVIDIQAKSRNHQTLSLIKIKYQ